MPKNNIDQFENYWDNRFSKDNKIWGESPSETAKYALNFFLKENVKDILIPGAGYGRNTKLFSANNFSLTGIEVSKKALSIAEKFDLDTKFINGSVLSEDFGQKKYDAIYCFNLLHLFKEDERKLFINKCQISLKKDGLIFFVVFSEKEKSFGKGYQSEKNTFESKKGRPVHYFNEDDLISHFKDFEIIETGLMEDTENHGLEGKHTHLLRYIYAKKN